MPRTSEAAVRGELKGDYDAEGAPSLSREIRRAGLLADRCYTCAIAQSLLFLEDELEEIETLLAAHFYTQGDPAFASRSTAGASGQFTGQFGMGLSNSRYGQQAMVLDLSGFLRSLDKGRAVAGGEYLGTPASGQRTWYERNW